MTRPGVAVRDAVPGDLPDLMAMWAELRELGGRVERTMPSASEDGVLDRLRTVSEDPDSRAVVATIDGETAGMALLNRSSFAPLFDQSAVHVHYLHVREGFRRRGVGHALLAAAVAMADEVGAEHVLTSVLPHLRETQRFYARLGFGPVVVRRSVPVSMLRRRLAGEVRPSTAGNVLAKRRTLRRVRAAVARVTD
ncbi:MAG: N-acetyltransferase family protein [Actinomycetes bacterium]